MRAHAAAQSGAVPADAGWPPTPSGVPSMQPPTGGPGGVSQDWDWGANLADGSSSGPGGCSGGGLATGSADSASHGVNQQAAGEWDAWGSAAGADGTPQATPTSAQAGRG